MHRYIERTKRARTESRVDATEVHEGGRAGSEAAEAICYARFPRFRRRLSPPLDQSSSVLFLPPPSPTLPALAVALFYIAGERLDVFNRESAFSVTNLRGETFVHYREISARRSFRLARFGGVK